VATGLVAPGEIDIARRPAARARFAAWLASGGAMVSMLIAPAVWNGFPIIFPDTGGYLTRPLEGSLELGRSAVYGLFLDAGMPFAFWPNVIAQSTLTLFAIMLTLRVLHFGGKTWIALGIVALLTFATSLPWLAGQLLPDILFPLAVLALYLLAFRSDQLVVWERVALGCVAVFAVLSHMAAAGLCVGLLIMLWLVGRFQVAGLPKPRLSFAASAVVAGLVLCPISNWAITGTFAFTPGGSSFLFGRLVEDGIIARYLQDRCPDPAIRLCAYRADMPDIADDWLWDSDSPFRKLGGWRQVGKDEREIILATLIHYPLQQISAAISDTVQQLISFQTEVSLDNNEPTIGAIHGWTPRSLPRLMAARQQRHDIDTDALNLVHVPVAALAMIGILGAVLARRRLKLTPQLGALCATILLALFVNAAICGIFSHPVDRYQSRLAPLALFAAALVAIEWQSRAKRGTAANPS
jgi:hypothetical protein